VVREEETEPSSRPSPHRSLDFLTLKYMADPPKTSEIGSTCLSTVARV